MMEQEEVAFEKLRAADGVMGIVCSFLPVAERYRLGWVDGPFRKARGTFSPVYGEQNLDPMQAFLEIKRWKDYIDSPQGQFGPDYEREGIDSSWFTLVEGYDLKRIDAEWNGSRSRLSKKCVIACCKRVNKRRAKMKKVEQDVQSLLPNCPYDVLYDSLRKNGLGLLAERFLLARHPTPEELLENTTAMFRARQTPIQEEGLKHILELKEFDESGAHTNTLYMNPLHGRVKYMEYPNNEPIFVKICYTCKKFKEDVFDQTCCKEDCLKTHPVCKSCRATCSTCGKAGCSCRFFQCCVEGCTNLMCNCRNFDGRTRIESGAPSGCAFVKSKSMRHSEDHDDPYENRKELYCMEHQPMNAKPYTSSPW